MSEKKTVKAELSREMTLFQVTMMGVGMMIGAGVFVATGIGIGMAGPGGMLLALSLNGLIMFFSVMTYAELGSALPRAGGGYSYVQESRGGFPAFLTGWISWFGHAVAGSLYAITFAKYTLHYLCGFETFSDLLPYLPLLERAVAVLIILIFLAINYSGAGKTGRTGAIIALGQTAVLLLIGLGGLIVLGKNPERTAHFTPFLTEGWGKVLTVMGFSLVGFEGYEVISNTAEEVVDAKKNVPKGIFIAVITVITTYLLVGLAAIIGGDPSGGSLSEWFAQKGATGFADGVGRLFPFGNLLAFGAALFASTSALNATIFSSTRVSFALGRDHYLPEPFSRISPKTRIPHVALSGSGIITLIVAAFFDVETVMAGASLFFIFLFSIVTFFGMKIRLERGHELSYGYLIPLFPVIPILSILLQLLIGAFLLDISIKAYLIAAVWLTLGVLSYLAHGKTRQAASKEYMLKTRHGEESSHNETRPAGKAIIVALKNEETASLLTQYARILAKGKGEKIRFITVVPIPYQTPVKEASRFSQKEEALLLNTLKEENPGEQGFLRYAHNTVEGLMQGVRSHNGSLLVLGWNGEKAGRPYLLGRVLDPAIERTACDLLVIKPGKNKKEIKRILCALRGNGPNGKLVQKIATLIAKEEKAEITVLTIKNKDSEKQPEERFLSEGKRDLPEIPCKQIIITADDPVKTIVKESKDYDILLLGASEVPLFSQILFGSLPRRIGERADCTVIMVRKNTGLKPWFKRWFL
ncbi:MAG: amino acid permease [Spirochaetales bacterium]|nr:amino acid permease [Spirochaetales bacterium]